ncbi:hypothetical protein K3722_12195 [Leisingera caerulea]|uniref:N-acetyltransferase domain-containing protein n=1 Tax=Leisingera caerulea TaxID=506591 RepID=A0ABY5WSR8_LEICA|nr:hypothetical protein [Leisingera caerulea]UWQ57285.1 hypothetical protein K3722_12195 [Leisingera caerulea]
MKSSLRIANGETVDIDVDDCNYITKVRTRSGEVIGSIQFRFIEFPSGEVLKMTHAFLDELGPRYLDQGIGTECVRLMREATGLPIIASPDDGSVKPDGSHLTGRAPAFVEKLIAKGLISEA